MQANKTEQNKLKEIFSGAEIYLVKLIAPKLNMTLEVYPNRIVSTNTTINRMEEPIYNG